MSRSNPYLRKRRYAQKTLLIFGEGLGEEMFLKHLRKLYSFNSGVAVTIKRGKGGNALNIIIDADKIIGAYDRKIVILDDDKPSIEMVKARQEAQKRRIELIENTPCLEFLLLTIIDKEPNGQNSIWCKNEFESKFIDKKKRDEPSEYDKLFTKELLNSKRSKLVDLNKLILIMEGK